MYFSGELFVPLSIPVESLASSSSDREIKILSHDISDICLDSALLSLQ